MLVLIIYDLFLVDIKAKVIFFFCVLYVADIVLGFLYMNDIIDLKLNTLVRLIFLVFYPRYTRLIIQKYFKFIYKARKMFFLYLSVVVLTGMCLFVLYYDIEDDNTLMMYSKLDFSTISHSIYTSYTIMTFQNILELFSFTITNQPIFLLFLIPLYYTVLFLVFAFIVAMMAYFYQKLIKRDIKNLSQWGGFKNIFHYY